ncbi:VOC family protein [Arthrobacter sp. ES3-54]|uniref:VOC family protein n=1 Tax=Arthrobacter sp. ES3-54 TaxID=1502991 RepID=UPI0024066DE2|nr:VOC family protein [Arthrobacter sp. ES3-54]MDF9752479.1 catechol-2,3-dioxygenase [Arthrobacter sp. ES3-54]
MIGKWQALVIDCEDPDKLASFYQELLGMIRVQENDEFISIGDAADRPAVALQRVERLVRPQWPDADHPQQMHVDVLVADLDAAEAEVLRLGATSLDAGTDTFRVYTDPSGHPFCLVLT